MLAWPANRTSKLIALAGFGTGGSFSEGLYYYYILIHKSIDTYLLYVFLCVSCYQTRSRAVFSENSLTLVITMGTGGDPPP